MMAAHKNIPALRFPQFIDAYKKSKIKEIAVGKLSNGVFNDPLKVGTGYYLINVKDMYSDLSIDKFKLSRIELTENEFKNNKVKYGDIFFTRSSLVREGIAHSAINLSHDNDITFDGHLIKLSPNLNKVNAFYLGFLFKNFYIRKQLMARGKTGTMTTIGQNDIESVEINLPLLPEQQKIASFLSSVDQRIQLLTRKKEQLEQYKKGLMQQIFSQQLRFKDELGKEFPEWEEKRLGEIGKTFSGLTGKTKEDFGEGNPYIQYMQIFKDSKININQCDYVKIIDGENQNAVQYGDIFFTTSSETPDEIGTASVLTDRVEGTYLNSFCFGYRPDDLNNLLPDFSRFFFRSEPVRKMIVKLAQGSTRYNMSKLELMKLSFLFPSKQEQQKIASFLSSIDDKITHVNTQIEQTRKWKQGLLQKMFV